MGITLARDIGGERPRRLLRLRGRSVAKVAMIAPAMALFIAFYLLPVGSGVVLSFFEWNGLQSPRWIGLENYSRVFADPFIATNIRVTLTVVAMSLVCTLPIAVLLAVCLSGKGPFLGLFRTLLFLPVVVPLAAAGLLWSEVFNPSGGLANDILGVFGLGEVTWLGDRSSALWALIIVWIWTTFGLHVVVQLSALSAIPESLREAARLETASRWRVFRHVVLPLMRESLTVSAVLLITSSFAYFTGLAYIMTRGGPLHATEVLGLRAFVEATAASDFGRANAVTVVNMALSIALVGVALLIGSRRRVEY